MPPPRDTPALNELPYLLEARKAGTNGEGLRLRKGAGLTQEEMGGFCGVSGPAIARWENGDRIPRGAPAVAYGRLLQKLRRQLEKVPA